MKVSRCQTLVIPELASLLKSTNPEFTADRILAGGMGQCIRLVQGHHVCALKIIHSKLVQDDESWRRYLREVKVWMTVSACEGVAEALCAVRVNGLPAVCSVWMNGGNLSQHLEIQSPEFFFSVMARVVGTLSWVHKKYGIIHRDLKPDNILLNEAGDAFVSDWGLARALTTPDSPVRNTRKGSTCSAGLTEAGSFLGTIAYASPEQILGSADLDHRADIYSLGVLMYQWEAGRLPFQGVTSDEIALKQLFERPRRLGGFFRSTKLGVEELISTCLEKDPKKRPRNYDDLDSALADAAKRRGIRYSKYNPWLRYEMPVVGAGEFQQQMLPSQLSLWNLDRAHEAVDWNHVEKYLHEAGVLTTTGDYAQAEAIYSGLFVKDVVISMPDQPRSQHVTVNYALCLTHRGRYEEAIAVLQAISNAKVKTPEYYVNLSLAQIRTEEHSKAIQTAKQGLGLYPADPDLLGNLLAAQTGAGLYVEAAETARRRLEQTRDVHSLLEVSELHSNYADTVRESDWPLAVKTYSHAAELLLEAKQLNPRDLRVRILLPVVLESMGAYAKCSAELETMHDLPLTNPDRLFTIYLRARCLDRVAAYKECWDFCNKWIKWITSAPAKASISKQSRVRLERVRAVAVSDGFGIGKMDGERRVAYRGLLEFFTEIVQDQALRKESDFCYLARHQEWMDQPEQAYAVLASAEKLYPEFWEIPLREAEFRYRSGDHAGALEPAERATVLGPWRPQTWDLFATILQTSGKEGDAERVRKRGAETRLVCRQLTEQIDK